MSQLKYVPLKPDAWVEQQGLIYLTMPRNGPVCMMENDVVTNGMPNSAEIIRRKIEVVREILTELVYGEYQRF